MVWIALTFVHEAVQTASVAEEFFVFLLNSGTSMCLMRSCIIVIRDVVMVSACSTAILLWYVLFPFKVACHSPVRDRISDVSCNISAPS